jgi:hypothetical protein
MVFVDKGVLHIKNLFDLFIDSGRILRAWNYVSNKQMKKIFIVEANRTALID